MEHKIDLRKCRITYYYAAELQPTKDVTFKFADGINRKISPIESTQRAV